jgi:tetratricopeptide (TPR) repeat protein
VDLQRANKAADAEKSFERAVDLNTNNIPAAVNLEFNRTRSGKGQNEVSRPKDVFGQYRSWDQILYDNGPFDVPELLYAQGHTWLQQFLVRQACDAFHRSSELAPTNTAPKMALASALIRGKWLDEAEKEVAALNQETNRTTAGQKLELISMEAAIHFARQDTNRAEATLLAAMEKYPRALTFFESLNEMYRASGQWDKALELLNREVSMMPTNVSLLMQRADLALNVGDTNTTSKDLETVLKIDPGNVDASMFQAFMAIEQKDYPKALKAVDGVLERDPKNVQALTYRGTVLMETKQDEKAIEAFTKALKIQPNITPAIQNRAIVNLRAGHLSAAKDDYETLLGAYPKAHQIYYGLAEIALKKKDNAEAIKNYEQYLKYGPTNVIGEAAEERKTVEARVKELKANK